MIALDLGGVLARVDKEELYRSLHEVVEDRALIDAAYFGGDRHRAVTEGQLSPERFLDAASAELGIHQELVERAWRAVVALEPDVEETLALIPPEESACVWSNIDPLHWAELAEPLAAAARRAARDQTAREEAAGEGTWELLSPQRRALSFEVGGSKPDPAFFHAALRRAGLQPAEVLFLDDRQANVDAAAMLGINARLARGPIEAAEVLRSWCTGGV